jgi:hypothetical protein
MYESVTNRLAAVDLAIHSCWFYDVPERFFEPRELYVFLLWNFLDDPPYSFDDLQPVLSNVFHDHARNGAVEIRHRRFLWTCMVDQ